SRHYPTGIAVSVNHALTVTHTYQRQRVNTNRTHPIAHLLHLIIKLATACLPAISIYHQNQAGRHTDW
ncbi:MAG: hypothetical protein J6589_09010, partial [Snodgrassella sp.]|uniref:hypothetical protein n=1 Tax=Snodgrassella sp. TaxID=2815304 RepID=UPI002586E35C